MIFIIKMEGTGGHGNMITGLRLNSYAVGTLPKKSKLSYKIIIKTFGDKNDPEIKFYRLANRLGKDQPQFDYNGNQIDTIKADPVFQELLKWMPEYHGVFDINKVNDELDDTSIAEVKRIREEPVKALEKKIKYNQNLSNPDDKVIKRLRKKLAKLKKANENLVYLIMEDITFRDGYHIDLKMGTRRFDSSAIAKHLKCEEHKDKGKTKLQTQTDKRDKSQMIKNFGVNIVAGKAPASNKCLNKSNDKHCIMGDQKSKDYPKSYWENSYEKVKRSLLDIFLPRPKDKINLINVLKNKLEEINKMFKIYLRKYGLHFFSSSLFITLDKNRTSMKIKMIDFAHVEAKKGNEFDLPTFRPETDANKECQGKTPDLLNNEKNTFDIGYMKGLNTLLKMIEEKKKELSDQPAQLPSERSGDGYKIKF